MTVTTQRRAARPEGFEPPTLGFEGRSSGLLTPFAADRAFSLRPVFEAFQTPSDPSRSIQSGFGSLDLSQIRPTLRAA